MNEPSQGAIEMPRFEDLWPARELGSWIVALEEGLRGPQIEAPFVRAFSLWLRARRDAGMLGKVLKGHGRLAWQIEAWNSFVDGTDDARTRQMLDDLGHAMHRGFVLTEWAMNPNIDPTRSARVSAMHRRIVDQIEKGDTDDVVSEWPIRDRRTDSNVTIVFHGWSPSVSNRVWEETKEEFRAVVPVPDEGVPIAMHGDLLVFVDPFAQPHLDGIMNIAGEDFDETTRQGRIAYGSEIAERHDMAVIRVGGPVDILVRNDDRAILVVDQGKTFPGYGFVGHMSPVGDRIVAGDVVSVSKATSSRSSVEDVTRMGPIVCAPVISWLLHGEDTKNDEGLDPSKIPATDGVHALLRGIARSKKGNPVVDAMKGISETIDRIVRDTR